ncbi:MAG: DNA adenine methylase [Planctomycetia bacterium]|nr:DNA adenine methylase [Planctomycetia bacterium]
MLVQSILLDNGAAKTSIQCRRYLGNKYRLLPFIDSVISQQCEDVKSLADIFAGTGVVASLYPEKRIITNDILFCNYLCHVAWFGEENFSMGKILTLTEEFNRLEPDTDNYMSENFRNTYFNLSTCRKIGAIRENIEQQYQSKRLNFREYALLIASLLYGMDKIANTCGHYDAFRRGVELSGELEMKVLDVSEQRSNRGNRCYNEDANILVRNIQADLVYIDPPYNSRQYSDAYHVLENVARWEKPEVFGVARKMDRGFLKSRYCTRAATAAFRDLIEHIRARYILVSYNNMAESGHGRSNAKISDTELLSILLERGEVQVFSTDYKAFTTGKSNRPENEERLFLVSVR